MIQEGKGTMENEKMIRVKGEERAAGSVVMKLLLRPSTPSIVFSVILIVVFSAAAGSFLSFDNIQAILIQTVVIGIMAIALNFVILLGEIDISVGSQLAVCAYVFGYIVSWSDSLALGLVAAMSAGGILGLINGLLVAKLNLSSFIVTLATQNVLRGILLVYAGGGALNLTAEHRTLGIGTFLGINISVYVFLLVFIICAMLSRHTVWGRDVFAVGGNQRAAVMAGLPVKNTYLKAYVLLGVCCGLTGGIFLCQIGQLQAAIANGYEMRVIAAVAIGGTSMAGGRGSALSPLVGSILIGIILNGMSVMAVPSTFESLVLGAIILLAVAVDAVRHKVVNKHYE